MGLLTRADRTASAAVAGDASSAGRRTTKALQAVSEAQDVAARWQVTLSTRQAELASLEERVGAELVAAPEAEAEALSARLAGQIVDLRGAVATAEQAATAAGVKVQEALLAAVVAERDDVRELYATARKTRDEHKAQVDKLLAALVDLDGVEFVARQADRDVHLHGPGDTGGVSRLSTLTDRVRELAGRLAVLEVAASGQPAPTFAYSMPIPPRLRPVTVVDDARGDGAHRYLELVAPGLVDQQVLDDVRDLALFGL